MLVDDRVLVNFGSLDPLTLSVPRREAGARAGLNVVDASLENPVQNKREIFSPISRNSRRSTAGGMG